MTQHSPVELVALARRIIEAEADAVRACARQIDASMADAVAAILASHGRVLVSGIGTSHAVALRLAHLLSCCGTPAHFVHPSDALHGASGAVMPDDVVIVISKGGESDDVNRFAAIARDRGALLIVMTERPESSLGRSSDIVLHVTAPADSDPFGMVATGSSLVNAACGDALCVVLLTVRGYTLEEFAGTHPGGAVGHRIAGEQKSHLATDGGQV